MSSSAADMEGKCSKCERVTKYKCLECFSFICNVCSKVSEDHEKYSEEDKLIGKCEQCDGSVEIIAINHPESSNWTNKQQQTTLEGLFKMKAEKPKIDEQKTQKTQAKRMVTVDTVEKSWKNVVLAQYDANDWLIYETSGKNAINLKCKLCFRYVKHINNLKGF